ncbi:MAG: IucA/IucC family siderophore biosynthesis protein [Gammaproteobacteria bacterium]|nr:MAG: IucA/IucC family siderophore biosynthesis protein [Gammaproteobacteria bacterium]UTW42759.1 IucA/IucC family siderophore biosynthesis protein [bacterium SCSIO 12844]
MKINLSLWRNERKYIILRILNTMIREKLFQYKLLDRIKLAEFNLPIKNKYIQINLNEQSFIFEVTKAEFLQTIKIISAQWFIVTSDNQLKPSSNIIKLIQLIFNNFSLKNTETSNVLKLTIDEYKQAVLQHIICQKHLSKTFKYADRNLYYYDFLASFLDHPLYPTARAKLGFINDELLKYSIENQAEFKLQWVAIEKHHLSNQGQLPDIWPNARDLKLDKSFDNSHFFIPYHPKMYHEITKNLNQEDIPFIIAKKSYLTVMPTLSIRTVIVKNLAQTHIKLPLNIRTLSAKNIRTIKASTINDGHQIQSLLNHILKLDTHLDSKVQLTDESCGGHINENPTLAYIIRRYPNETNKQIIVPIAALTAQENQQLVIEKLAKEHFNGDLKLLLTHYIKLNLVVHLNLVLNYGIALEANQQNSQLIINPKDKKLSLLLKDNDSARINSKSLLNQLPSTKAFIDKIQDKRIIQADETALIQMFSTIILQLNIACVLEALIDKKLMIRKNAYRLLTELLNETITQLDKQGINTKILYDTLFNEDYLDIKYLYTSGTFLPKSTTQASDINKFYGKSAPNFLRMKYES